MALRVKLSRVEALLQPFRDEEAVKRQCTASQFCYYVANNENNGYRISLKQLIPNLTRTRSDDVHQLADFSSYGNEM